MLPDAKIYQLSELLENPDQVAEHALNHPVALVVDHQVKLWLISGDALANMTAATSLYAKQADAHPIEKAISHPVTPPLYLTEFLAIARKKWLHKFNTQQMSAKCYEIYQYRADKHVAPFFSGIELAQISYTTLSQFLDYLASHNIGISSASQYLLIVKQSLNEAMHAGKLDRMPEFPKLKPVSNSRGAFTLQEYLALLRTGWRLRNRAFYFEKEQFLNATGLDQRLLVMREEMYRLIGFMVNSFVRPSDIKVMKHSHVHIVENTHSYLRLTLPETKRHNMPIVTLMKAVVIYRKLQQKALSQGFGQSDDYVFFPDIANRDYAMRMMGFLFNWLLHETGLKTGPHGIGRTMYSLRHTAITFRLLYGEGIDMLTLARNARTSVAMIEKHYASTLNGEMNIGILQSKRQHRNQ
ncbi:hypothetical protein SAMN05192566_2334 [Methylophilus rhizosphaerae]|uniref:Tyr recombinase domain-containing protein n=1 Tax=Methylophilus rhizosphaerae TaxID=492660 RepID=A0A1G9EDX4_9PROT|nr:phage integrase SAM-like domain-containing protein [Methylophilus rhizosphaerae]SDK74347.1 hypothetical protein SAMN05192566_2334 [Methylophilus rhizosphaerae]